MQLQMRSVKAFQHSGLSASRTAVAPRRSVIPHFKSGDVEGRLREVATLREQPITEKYQPPYDLHNIIPNPGVRLIVVLYCYSSEVAPLLANAAEAQVSCCCTAAVRQNPKPCLFAAL